MPTPQYNNYISAITLPDNITYHIKDSEARQWIEDIIDAGVSFILAWDGGSEPDVTQIPEGVTVTYGGQPYVGQLAAGPATKGGIYLVWYDTHAQPPRDAYEEWVVIDHGENYVPANERYFWEMLGTTDINFDQLGQLAWKNSVTLNKGSGDIVLGEATTFTNSSSSVTFTGGTSDTFVKSYPGTNSKLETTTITGTGSNVTFNAVNTNTSVTATNTIFGTDVTASKITTESKTATNTVFGTNTTASKAVKGTAVTLAKPASSATNATYVGNSNTSSVLETATVSGEVMTIGAVHITQNSVTGINGSQEILPYTFTDVTVPVVTSNTSVSVASVKTNTDVTVPVVTSNTEVTATNTTITSKTAATKAASATTVATGSLNASDTSGATVMTGLGNPTTASALTNVGTGTAAAQTITVGTNDKVSVAKYSDLSVTVS